VSDTAKFPSTRRSVILAVARGDPPERERGWQTLVAAYWKPVYKYVRLKWNKSVDDAEDLTQAFFAAAMDKEIFRGYDPAKGTFRNFLRLAIDGFASNQEKAARRIKRGGGAVTVPLDFHSAEGEFRRHEIASGESLDDYFHREWVRGLFGLAVDRLRDTFEAEGKRVQFLLFQRYDLRDDASPEKLTYDQLAREFNLPVTTVTNHLASVRRRFRATVLDILREITANDREFRGEARAVLGVDPA
jgi:RNA polymerase sigma factor (sigma-70 family)